MIIYIIKSIWSYISYFIYGKNEIPSNENVHKELLEDEKHVDEKHEDEEKIENCAICLEKIVNDLYKTPCDHLFHQDCLLPWMEKHNECPLSTEKDTHSNLPRTFNFNRAYKGKADRWAPMERSSSNSPKCFLWIEKLWSISK